MRNKFSVYLAGAINGKSDTECKDWRESVRSIFEKHDITVLDPMTRDYRGKEDENVDAIVEGDLEDIKSCDFVLVNAENPSWGTAMELVYAKQYGKISVAFLSSARVSPWLKYHTHSVCPTMGLACDTILYLKSYDRTNS